MDSPDTREAHDVLPDWREFHRRRFAEDLRFLQYVSTTPDELRFFVEVQKLEMDMNPYDIEKKHKLYGEGMARVMYDEYADTPWLLSAYRYADKLGVMDKIKEVMKANPKHFPKDQAIPLNYVDWVCGNIEQMVQSNRVHVRYVPSKTDLVLTDIPGRPNYKARLKATGQHDVCVAKQMMANFLVVDDKAIHDTIILMDEQLKKPGNAVWRFITLMHELGHEDELLKEGVYLINTDTGKAQQVQTEFFSTGMALGAGLLLYQHTHDPVWIKASAWDGTLRDWIMRGHPANYMARNATPVREKLDNLQIVRNTAHI